MIHGVTHRCSVALARNPRHRAAVSVVTWITGLCAVVATLMVGAPSAVAHDVVIHANPGVDATVAEFPTQIELEFSGIPQPQFNTVAVSNADTGEILFTNDQPELDKQFVRVDVPPGLNTPDGEYIVGFQITSSDGHATRGRTSFRLDSGRSSETAADVVQTTTVDMGETPSEQQLGESSHAVTYGLIGLGALALLIACIVVLLRRWRAH